MARSRNIKPGFFESDELAECGIEAHLLFAGLWTIADKEGRLNDRPKRIGVACLPYYQADVDACLDRLQSKGFLTRYEFGGNRFIQIHNWHKHQSPHHKEIESEIPPPPEKPLENKGQSDVDPTLAEAQGEHEPSLPQAPESGIRNQVSGIRYQVSGIRNQVSRKRTPTEQSHDGKSSETQAGKAKTASGSTFDGFWEAVPKKAGKEAAKKSYEKAKARIANDRGITSSEAAELLLDRMKAFAASPKASGKYCPHPSTWLNSGCYDDDPATWEDCKGRDDGYDRDAVISEADRKYREAVNGSR